MHWCLPSVIASDIQIAIGIKKLLKGKITNWFHANGRAFRDHDLVIPHASMYGCFHGGESIAPFGHASLRAKRGRKLFHAPTYPRGSPIQRLPRMRVVVHITQLNTHSFVN